MRITVTNRRQKQVQAESSSNLARGSGETTGERGNCDKGGWIREQHEARCALSRDGGAPEQYLEGILRHSIPTHNATILRETIWSQIND